MSGTQPWVLAARGSALSLAQAEIVKKLLESEGIAVKIQTVSTGGDRDQTRPLQEIGGKGLFVKDIEAVLCAGEADIAVHSGKDLPYLLAQNTVIGGVPQAESPADCLVSCEDHTFPEHPIIGTDSPRRVSQMQKRMPEAEFASIRGNVDTRLKKLKAGMYDGILLAEAGLRRLGADLSGLRVEMLSPETFIPAPCQGILAVQCRADDTERLAVLERISDRQAQRRFVAERELFCLMQADCAKAVGAYALLDGERLTLYGLFGEKTAKRSGMYEDYKALCGALARELTGGEAL